jgi:polyhydroxyalkanoate synthesis regulator phasin
MTEQAEFLKSVKDSFSSAQAKATARIETLSGDARKLFDDLVERGRVSQKDLSEKFQKLTGAETRGRIEELSRRVRELQTKAVEFVDSASRDQAGALAAELRKLADRLETLARKDDSVAHDGASTLQ